MWSEVLDQAAFTFSLGFPRAREARGAIEAPMRAFVMSRLLFVMSRLLEVADVRFGSNSVFDCLRWTSDLGGVVPACVQRLPWCDLFKNVPAEHYERLSKQGCRSDLLSCELANTHRKPIKTPLVNAQS
jgi:hypothetical protein